MASSWMEPAVDKDTLLLERHCAHRFRYEVNNISVKVVQPHNCRVWQVEPCRRLGEVARRSRINNGKYRYPRQLKVGLHGLRSLLSARPGPTILLWVPGNELADSEAKTADPTISDPPRPITYSSARSLIRRTLTDPPPANLLTLTVFGGMCGRGPSCAPSYRPHSAAESLRYCALLCPMCKEGLRRCPRLDVTRLKFFTIDPKRVLAPTRVDL